MGVALITIAAAQNPPPVDEAKDVGKEEEESAFLEGDLLPDGSILKGVKMPSYSKDGKLRLTSSIRADEIVIVDRGKINAENLLIEMFDDKGEPDGRIAMKKARFLRSKEQNLLISDDPVSIVSKKLTADGAGLVFDTDNTRGFLRGPVKAVAEFDTLTSMNARPARNAFAAGALLMASAAPLSAQAPQAPEPSVKEPTTAERFAELRLKPEDKERIAADTASRRQDLTNATEAAEAQTKKAMEGSEDARITMNGFLQSAALTSLMVEPPAAASGDVPGPVIAEDPMKTTITSKDGAYFDSVAGLAIFLKAVEVLSPEFQLKGADELKIFTTPQPIEEEKTTAAAKKDGTQIPTPEGVQLEPGVEPPKPKPSKPKKTLEELTPEELEKMIAAKAAKDAEGGADATDGKPKDGKAKGKQGSFGEVKRLVATGVIEIFYKSTEPKDSKKDPKEKEKDDSVRAAARTVIYDVENEQIILKGGSPWIIQGTTFSRATGPDAYFLVNVKKGKPVSFVVGDQEKLETHLVIEQDDDNKPGTRKPDAKQKEQTPKETTPKNR